MEKEFSLLHAATSGKQRSFDISSQIDKLLQVPTNPLADTTFSPKGGRDAVNFDTIFTYELMFWCTCLKKKMAVKLRRRSITQLRFCILRLALKRALQGISKWRKSSKRAHARKKSLALTTP